jgi:hypothetical protein
MMSWEQKRNGSHFSRERASLDTTLEETPFSEVWMQSKAKTVCEYRGVNRGDLLIKPVVIRGIEAV